MRKFKFNTYVRIQNESFDISFHLSGDIFIDFDAADETCGPCDKPGDPNDEPYEDDDPDWPAQWQS